MVRTVARVAAERGVPVTWAEAGMGLRSGAWDVRVIGAVGDVPATGDANQRCLVLVARARGLDSLLTGDAESPVPARPGIPLVDLVQVSHHGSEDPGLPGVLARATPALAVVPAGAGNPFGHPRAQAFQAARDVGARVLRTDCGGDIDARAGTGGVIVRHG